MNPFQIVYCELMSINFFLTFPVFFFSNNSFDIPKISMLPIRIVTLNGPMSKCAIFRNQFADVFHIHYILLCPKTEFWLSFQITCSTVKHTRVATFGSWSVYWKVYSITFLNRKTDKFLIENNDWVCFNGHSITTNSKNLYFSMNR